MSGTKPLIFNTEQYAHIVHTLKSERCGSYYAGSVMTWNHETLDGEWLEMYLQIFTKKVEIPQEFIDKYNVKQYHINLIRRMYFDSNDLDSIDNLEYKRPYGNSGVIFDVFDEYNEIENIIVEDPDGERKYEWVNNNNDFLQNIHNETMDILDLMLKELDLKYCEWENIGVSWSPKWQPTQRAFRKLKLERIVCE